MITTSIFIAMDHQETLRVQAAAHRMFTTASRPSLRERLASAVAFLRSALGSPELDPGSVLPAAN